MSFPAKCPIGNLLTPELYCYTRLLNKKIVPADGALQLFWQKKNFYD